MRHANKSEASVSKISVSQLQQQEIYSFNVGVLLWNRGASFLMVRGSSGWQSFLHPHSPRMHLRCTGICHSLFIWGYYRIRQDGGRWFTMKWWTTKNVLQMLRMYFSNALLPQPCYKGSSPEDAQEARQESPEARWTVWRGWGKLQHGRQTWDMRRRQRPPSPAGSSLLRDCNPNTEKDRLGLLCFH